MKLLNLYLFFTLFSTVHPSLIPTKKICKDCRHFIGDKIQCRKFSDTDIVTGEITYKSALSVREDEKKCGEDAIYFEENHFKMVTIPYYIIKGDFYIQSNILLITLIGLYIYALIYIYYLGNSYK